MAVLPEEIGGTHATSSVVEVAFEVVTRNGALGGLNASVRPSAMPATRVAALDPSNAEIGTGTRLKDE
jgi:hypothetical protein